MSDAGDKQRLVQVALDAQHQPSIEQVCQIFGQKLLDHGCPLYILDMNGSLSWSNHSYRELSDRIALPGGPVSLFPLDKILAGAKAGEKPGRHDATCLVDAEPRLLCAHHVIITDQNGERSAIAGLLEMKENSAHLAKELEHARERFDDIVRLTSDWVWEIDTSFEVTMISERVTKVLGYQPTELTGRRLSSIAENEAGAIALEQRLATMTPFRDHRFEARTNAAETRLFLISGVPTFSAGTGAPTGFRGTADDITDLARREHSLIQARDLAEMANRAKSDFLANMSHELRTPLNSIIGFADLLTRDTLVPTETATMREYGEDIKLSANHLLEMINDILDLSKIEAGRLRLNEEEISVAMLCEPVMRMISERALLAGLKLSSSVSPDLPLLLVDHRLARQILMNLLSNAVKFTPEGGKVDLCSYLGADGDLVIEVEDTGIGIGEKDIDRVLEPFIQVESHHARRYGGTGLGLALSRRLAELHGGRISLVSKPGFGTKVLLHIPPSRFR